MHTGPARGSETLLEGPEQVAAMCGLQREMTSVIRRHRERPEDPMWLQRWGHGLWRLALHLQLSQAPCRPGAGNTPTTPTPALLSVLFTLVCKGEMADLM